MIKHVLYFKNPFTDKVRLTVPYLNLSDAKDSLLKYQRACEDGKQHVRLLPDIHGDVHLIPTSTTYLVSMTKEPT